MKACKYFLAAALMVSPLALVSCGGENNNGDNPEQPASTVYETLVGTEWEGAFATTTSDGYRNYPVTIHWTLDFLSETSGEAVMWMESDAFDPDPYTFPFQYKYNKDNSGKITEIEYCQASDFTIDGINRQMECSLVIYIQHEENSDPIAYGGATTLTQTR